MANQGTTWIPLLGASVLAIVLACFSPPAVAEGKLPDLEQVLDQCGAPDQENFSCWGITYCGDGGCDPKVITVVLERSSLDTFASFLQALPVSKTIEMTDQKGDPVYYDDPNWNGEYIEYPNCEDQVGFDRSSRYARDRLTNDGQKVVEYCLEVFPGKEIEIAYLLSTQRWALFVSRTGGDAGSPPAYLSVSLEQFVSLRDMENSRLFSAVTQAVERSLGGECRISRDYFCTIVPAMGQVDVEVVFPGGPQIGDVGVWYRLEMSVFSYSPSLSWHSVVFSMPITQVRRWPRQQGMPSEGFQSVDEHSVFEQWRNLVMSDLASQLQAELVEPG